MKSIKIYNLIKSTYTGQIKYKFKKNRKQVPYESIYKTIYTYSIYLAGLLKTL